MAIENDFLPANEPAVNVRVPTTRESGDILRDINPVAKNTEWQKHSGVMISITDYQPTVTPETARLANIKPEDLERTTYTGALSAPGAIGESGRFWSNLGKSALDAAQDLPIIGGAFGERGTYKARQTLGATIIDVLPDGKGQEYGRKIASQASRQLQLMRERDGITDEEADTWGTAIGSGTVSMAEFVTASAMTGGSQIIPSVLAGIQGYSGGAGNDIEKYIAETGDAKLENYQGSVENLGINVASGAAQGAIEGLIGQGGRVLDTGKIATGNAYTTFLARWFAESGANALEEKLQTIAGETAELIKGNSELKEWFANSLLDWKDAGVGALLGGTMSLTSYNNSHIKGVNKLKKKIQEIYPDVQPAVAERAAEDMMNAGEAAVVQGASKNIDAVVAIADPNSELTAIVKKATLDTINAKIKESDGFADGDMTEEQRLQFADTFTKVLVSDALRESVEQGVPLTESPLMKAVGGTDGLFLSGRDYSALNDYLAEKIDETRRARWYKAGITTAESYAAFRETERKNAEIALDNELKRIEKEVKAEQEKHRKDMEKLANQIADARKKAEQRRMEKDMQELIRLSDKQKAEETRFNERMERLAERRTKMTARKEKTITAQQKINDIRKASRDELATFVNKIYGYQTRGLTDQALVELAINRYQNWEIRPKKKSGTQESIEQAEKAKRDRTRASTIKRVLEQDARDLASFTGVPESVIERMTDAEYKNFVDNATRLRAERNALAEQRAEIDETVLDEIDFNTFYQSNMQEQSDLADENARLDEVNPEYTGETIEVNGVERTVYNSNGERIAKSEPALRNFWNWFGNSKVVDKDSRPLVVYHGTSSEFDTFNIAESGKNTGTAIYGKGFYFTTNKEIATRWGAKRGEPIVMPVYIKLENPNLVEQLKYPKDSQEKGFDGVIAKVWGSNDLEVVAFEPNQIKSVNNRGTFSPDTGNVYFQTAYAGSRVDYDRPSLEAIGSGEGNQAHGWGLYYALNPEIALGYMNRFTEYSNPLSFNGKKYEYGKDPEYVPLQELKSGEKTLEQLKTEYQKNVQNLTQYAQESKESNDAYWERQWTEEAQDAKNVLDFLNGLENITKDDIKIIGGQVHKVDISEMDVLLDEQKNLGQQSQFVQKAVKKALKEAGITDITENSTGDEIYEALSEYHQSAKDASQMLEKYGIKGITYDGRRDGRCFVIFNPKDVKVLRKKFDELGNMMFQSKTTSGLKGKDDYRASYDAILDRILLGDNWDATSMMHEIAHRQAQRIYHAVHSGQASPELEKRWLAIEEWLGVPENYWKSHDFLGRQYQEQFARAYEKFLYDGKYANPELKTLFKDLNRQFIEIYGDRNDKYFDLKKELSPELLELFNQVQNVEINEAIAQNAPEVLVDNGAITESEAVELSSEVEASQAIDSLIAEDNKAQAAAEQNDITKFNTGKTIQSETATKFEEKTGIETDKERGRRELFAKVKPAAREFVLNNESLAFDIVSGKAAERDGLFRQDLYKALETYYLENNDLDGLMSLAPYTKTIGQEASARLSALRNDGTNFLQTLDNINDKIENKNKKQIEKETSRLESELDTVAFDWDESIDEQFMKDQECK